MPLVIEVAKTDLDQTLATVRPTVGSQDIYSHYLFRVRNGKVEVLTSVKRVASKAFLTPSTFSGEDTFSSFTVDQKSLDNLLKSVKAGKVTITFDGITVNVNSDEWKSDMDFESLDPAKFPNWDKLFENSKTTVKIGAARLSSFLSFGKGFALPEVEENTRPELCVLETVDGVLQAHNGAGTAMFVQVPEFGSVSLRVHVGSLPPLLKFLSTFGEGEDVEIRDGDSKSTFYVRPDGCVLGDAMFAKGIAPLKVDRTLDPVMSVTFDVAKYGSAVKFLSSGAAAEDNRLKFTLVDSTTLGLSMRAKANGREKTVQLPGCTVSGEADKFPQEGLTFSYVSLEKLISLYQDTEATLYVYLRGTKKGYVVAKVKEGSDEYFTLTVGLG